MQKNYSQLLNISDFFDGQYNNLFDSKFLFEKAEKNFDFNNLVIIKKMDWDTTFFKISCHRLFFLKFNFKNFNLTDKNIDFIFCRTNSNNIDFLNILFKNNFFIVNAKVFMYKKVSYNNLIGKNIFDIKKNPISYDILTKISEGAFRTGRFYKDRRFEKSKADQVYSNWIFDHLNSENCRLFYYKNETGKICGFIAVSINIPFPSENFKVGFVQLVCTDYEERKKGLASKLLAFAENYLAENQIEHFYSNTTFDNFSSIMLFIKNGFIVYNSIYELHWWKK